MGLFSGFRVGVNRGAAKKRAGEIERDLATLRQVAPRVSGIDLKITGDDGAVNFLAIDYLMRHRPGQFAIQNVSRLGPDHITIGYDQAFGYVGLIGEARQSGSVMAAGSRLADAFLSQKERALKLLG